MNIVDIIFLDYFNIKDQYNNVINHLCSVYFCKDTSEIYIGFGAQCGSNKNHSDAFKQLIVIFKELKLGPVYRYEDFNLKKGRKNTTLTISRISSVPVNLENIRSSRHEGGAESYRCNRRFYFAVPNKIIREFYKYTDIQSVLINKIENKCIWLSSLTPEKQKLNIIKDYFEGEKKWYLLEKRERNPQVVHDRKRQDDYKCSACGFSYGEAVIECHHLVPASCYTEKTSVTIENLITLCPTCHSLAHYALERNREKFTNRKNLIDFIQEAREKAYQ